jgi:hypothetical protein
MLPILKRLGLTSGHDAHVRNLHVHRLQCDEIWAFVGAKMNNASMENVEKFGWGDVWTTS